MCTIHQVSCQLSFYPLGENPYNHRIDAVIELIEAAPLQYEVGPMSTIIRGDRNEVFALLQKITETLDDDGCHFAMNAIFSNTCGCGR